MRFRLNRPIALGYDGYEVGTVAGGLPFILPKSVMDCHMMISGQTATGKSRFAMNLVRKAEKRESQSRFLIMDIEGEWKNLIPHLKGDTKYYAVEKNLKINPFELNDPALIRELLKQTVFKGIQEEYSDLSAQMNFVLQDTVEHSKSMAELIQNIKDYDKHKLTAIEKTKIALLVRLNPFLTSPLKEIFMCTHSSPEFERLDESNIIIDLHSLDAKVAYGAEIRLIYNIITLYYLRKMLSRGTRSFVSNYFVADEAQLLVPKILKKLFVTDSWYATTFATRLHKRGCSLILITQSPSNIEQDIFKNCGTKITFRLQGREDIKLISDSCGFVDNVEYQFLSDCFVKLEDKKAIVCTTNQEPFLIESDHFELKSFDPVVSVMQTEDFPLIEETNRQELSEDEKCFLQNVISYPFVSVRDRRSLLQWDSRRYSEIVDSLIKKNLIEKVKVRLGRGKSSILYNKVGSIPGVKHEYYVDWIRSRLERDGFKVETNKMKGADIVVPQIRTAIEVETGNSAVMGNVERNLSTFDFVVCCSDQKKVIEAVSLRQKAGNVFVSKVEDVPALVGRIRNGIDNVDL